MKGKSNAALYAAYHTKTEEVMAEIENGLANIKAGIEDKAFDEFYMAMKGTIEAPLSSVTYKKSIEMLADRARQQAKTFATNLTEAQLNTMAQTIADGLKEGLGTHQVARRLTMVTGLDSNRAKTYWKYCQDLSAAGISGDKLDRLQKKKFNELLGDRKRTIAQTEARFATSYARQKEAQAIGAKFKVWMTVGDNRVSQQCRSNQSAGPIPLKDAFPSGHSRPPCHPNCRCTLGFAMSKKQADLIHKEIEGQPYEKPVPQPPKPKVVKIKPQKIDDAVDQLNAAIPDIPDISLDMDALDPAALQTHWDEVDRLWEAKKPNLDRELTYFQDAKSLGGMHSKSIYKDAQGNSWLFKPQSEVFRTHGEEAAYKIGRWIDPDAVEVRACTLNGQTGSIQRLIPAKDLTGEMSEIADQFLDQVQREHVIDWLTSNHDAHPGQWIVGTDGHLYGIDKGQGWRFFGKDTLNINYHPNRAYGAPEPLYNTLFRDAKTAKWKLNEQQAQKALEYIKRAETIPADMMKAALKEYAEGRPGNASIFINSVLDRQKALRGDFEKYYSEILGKPFTFRDEIAATVGSVEGLAEAEYVAALEKHAADVSKLGAQGKTIRFDKADIEDQNLMVFTERMPDGTTRTVLSGKLRPEAEERFIKDFQAGVTSGEYTLTHGSVRATKRELRDGITWVKAEGMSDRDLFHRSFMPKGSQYTLKLSDGSQVIYRPFVGNDAYARAGQFEVTIIGDVSQETIRRGLEALNTLKVDTALATSFDEELMYLQKHAYLMSLDNKAAYKKMVQRWSERNISTEDQIKELRKYLEKKGVLFEESLYKPSGVYERGFLDDAIEAGYRVQYRADLPDAEFTAEMGDYVLQHRVTGGNDLESALEAILQNSGDMISTVEKLRIGIKPGGMSPEEDMKTGGASYFFTRIRHKNTTDGVGIFFKPDLLKRLDAISYDCDKYGRTTGNTPRTRAWNYEKWKKYAYDRGSDETIFKYTVNLLENVDHITTGSASERKKIIALFHKKGIFKLPDGRKVEEIIK